MISVERRRIMNRRRAAEGFTMRLAMTTMIDVVFLLLVFFVCTVRFERNEAVYRLDLPIRGSTADPLALQDAPLQVFVGERVGDQCPIEIRADGVRRETKDFDALAITMTQLRRKAGTNEGLFESSHPILIVPSAGSQWQDAVEGFNAAVRAGYANIGFTQSTP